MDIIYSFSTNTTFFLGKDFFFSHFFTFLTLITLPKILTTATILTILLTVLVGCVVASLLVLRPWRIVLLKVAYYATSSARQFWPNYCKIMLEFPNYTSDFRNYAFSQNDVRTTPKYVFQINCCSKFICFMAVCLVSLNRL